jgi:hypothetical protein
MRHALIDYRPHPFTVIVAVLSLLALPLGYTAGKGRGGTAATVPRALVEHPRPAVVAVPLPAGVRIPDLPAPRRSARRRPAATPEPATQPLTPPAPAAPATPVTPVTPAAPAAPTPSPPGNDGGPVVVVPAG